MSICMWLVMLVFGLVAQEDGCKVSAGKLVGGPKEQEGKEVILFPQGLIQWL